MGNVLPAPIDKEQAVRRIAAAIDSDVKHYSSWRSSFAEQNPVIRSSKFISEGGYAVFEAMNANPVIKNVMSASKDAVILRPWHIMPAIPNDPRQEFKAMFVSWVIDHIPFLDAKKKEMLSDKDYGYSVTEKIFAQKDVTIPGKTTKKRGIETKINGKTMKNALIVVDLQTKPCTAFDFDRYGNMLMAKIDPTRRSILYGDYVVNQFDYLSEEELRHFMVSTHDPQNGHRKGEPVKAAMFWSYLIEKATTVYCQIFAERQGMAIMQGTFPAQAEATPEGRAEVDAFEERLKGAQKNSYILAPEGFAINFIEAVGKSASFDIFSAIIERCHGNYREAALGDREAGKTPEDKEGSLHKDKLKVYCKNLDALFNDDLIKQLIDFNFEYDGFYPYMVTNTRTPEEIDKFLFQASTIHNIGYDLSLSQLEEVSGFRAPEDEADTLPGSNAGSTPSQPSADVMPPNPADAQNPAPDNVGGNNMDNNMISSGIVKTKGNPQQDAMK